MCMSMHTAQIKRLSQRSPIAQPTSTPSPKPTATPVGPDATGSAAYGLCTCAERTAFVRAVAEGASAFSAIAIAGADDGVPCPPCGSCRQILHELAPDLVVITDDESGAPRCTSLRELLPSAFGPGALPPRQKHA